MPKMTSKKRRLLYVAGFMTSVGIGTVALAATSVPSGFRTDIQNGAGIVSVSYGGNLHQTAAESSSRAEFRCNPDNSACSKTRGAIYFSGEFRVNDGQNVSLIQFLNIKGSGTTGGSEPISQLVVDDYRSSDSTYRVSIEQGDHYCGFRIRRGQWYDLEAGIARRGVGWFKLDGDDRLYCQRTRGTTRYTDRVAGDPYEDNYSGDNTYYLKYGAYNAAGNDKFSSVNWR